MATLAQLNNEVDTLRNEIKRLANHVSAQQLKALRKRKSRILYVIRKIKNHVRK